MSSVSFASSVVTQETVLTNVYSPQTSNGPTVITYVSVHWSFSSRSPMQTVPRSMSSVVSPGVPASSVMSMHSSISTVGLSRSNVTSTAALS